MVWAGTSTRNDADSEVTPGGREGLERLVGVTAGMEPLVKQLT